MYCHITFTVIVQLCCLFFRPLISYVEIRLCGDILGNKMLKHRNTVSMLGGGKPVSYERQLGGLYSGGNSRVAGPWSHS